MPHIINLIIVGINFFMLIENEKYIKKTVELYKPNPNPNHKFNL
jgi:hypothetical protein